MYTLFFFFNDTATTEIYTLSLHDALPISPPFAAKSSAARPTAARADRSCEVAATSFTRKERCMSGCSRASLSRHADRSEEHTSELQSRLHLVCRLLLEKKKKEENKTSENE